MTGSATQSMPLRHCERSEAIHLAAQRKTGLLRRFAPLRKRFAFVAGNDGGTSPSLRANGSRKRARPLTSPRERCTASGTRDVLLHTLSEDEVCVPRTLRSTK